MTDHGTCGQNRKNLANVLSSQYVFITNVIRRKKAEINCISTGIRRTVSRAPEIYNHMFVRDFSTTFRGFDSRFRKDARKWITIASASMHTKIQSTPPLAAVWIFSCHKMSCEYIRKLFHEATILSSKSERHIRAC